VAATSFGATICKVYVRFSAAPQARGKKDAKQLAAASLVEILLETIPFQNLLHKSEKHQLRELRAVSISS
jgi:hypothetical protein